MKRPAFQFYPGNWQSDIALRACSVGARGCWIEMMCLMHQAEPYGHLLLNGKAIGPDQLAGMIGGRATAKDVRGWLAELEANGVFSRNGDGSIFSRRMVRDEATRDARAEGGKAGAEHGIKGKQHGVLGGNPRKTYNYNEPGFLYLARRESGGPIKVGISKAVPQRLSVLRNKLGEPVRLIAKFPVDDMGTVEAAILSRFDGRRDGEWLDEEEGRVIEIVRGVITRGITPPLTPPPSSASAAFGYSEPNGSAGSPPAKSVDVIFGYGLPLLTAAGVTEPRARSMLGLMRKHHSDEAVVSALQRCAAERPLEPVAFLQGLLRSAPAMSGSASRGSRLDAQAETIRALTSSTGGEVIDG